MILRVTQVRVALSKDFYRLIMLLTIGKTHSFRVLCKYYFTPPNPKICRVHVYFRQLNNTYMIQQKKQNEARKSIYFLKSKFCRRFEQIEEIEI